MIGSRRIAIERGMLDIVRAIVELDSVDLNSAIALPELGYTLPLHVAADFRQSHLIPVLVFMGADVNARDGNSHESALHVAARRDDIWSVQNLIKCQADVSALTKSGETAISIAESKGATYLINLLTLGHI
jgi:ankyrin repeat protein